jgi:putative colanic acid biosynthesis acetyltransferase WcaF
MPLQAAPIHIGENVWVAADVYVGPGVTIGDFSVVGARSVVTGDLPAHMICLGHPCRPVKDRLDPT